MNIQLKRSLSRIQIPGLNRLVPTASQGFARINEPYRPSEFKTPELKQKNNKWKGPSRVFDSRPWAEDLVMESHQKHVVYTWGPSGPSTDGSIAFARGEGIYLYDYKGKEYIDLTSQAMCNNLGYDIPDTVKRAITKQLDTLPMVYGGISISEPRAKLAQILSDIMPEEITGFVFPCTGSEANEAAIRAARRFTGKQKIINLYRSYHGGTSNSVTATGDYRRNFGEAGVSGFVKFANFQSVQIKWGPDEASAINNYLAYFDEMLFSEGPGTIAAVMMEGVVGAGGVLVNPPALVQGIRALCDKYNILLIMDEVMSGFGRTGEWFAFQHYPGVVPDLVTMAKGLSSSYLPISAVGMKKEIQEKFVNEPLGWGTTYAAHPVSCVAAFEVINHMIDVDVVGQVKEREKTLIKLMNELADKHNSVRQGRCIGLFAAIDIAGQDGNQIVRSFTDPVPEKYAKFKKKLAENGIVGLMRPPFLYIAPPLIITDDELKDACNRISDALTILDY